MAKARSVIPKVHFSLPQVASFAFETPNPPSTNNLFATNISGKRYVGSKYATWRQSANVELQRQGGAKAVRGPVIVTVTIPDHGRGDLDNRLKALLDFCVHHGIIEDDKREVVREIRIGWGDVPNAIVEIRKAYDWLQRRDLKARRAA